MKKNLIPIIITIGIFSWSAVFALGNAKLPRLNSTLNLPRIYNPISGYYEQKTEEEIKQEMFANMDYYSDSSLQKFLDDNHPLAWSYEANDIVKINSDFTSNKSSDFYLRKEAAEAFEHMARAFSNAFGFKATVLHHAVRNREPANMKHDSH